MSARDDKPWLRDDWLPNERTIRREDAILAEMADHQELDPYDLVEQHPGALEAASVAAQAIKHEEESDERP